MLDSNDIDSTNNLNNLEFNDSKLSNNNSANIIQHISRHNHLNKTNSENTELNELNILNSDENDQNFKLSPRFLKALRRRSKTYSGEEIQIILNDSNSNENQDKYCASKYNNSSKNEKILKDNNDINISRLVSNLKKTENKTNKINNGLDVKLIKKNIEGSLSNYRRFFKFFFTIVEFRFYNFLNLKFYLSGYFTKYYFYFSSSIQEELLRRNSFNRRDYGSLELVS